jgi:hypothetical protein
MKERPLPFSASMVRAILDGRKTMTRRIIQPHLVSDSHWQPTEPVYWLDDDNSVPLCEAGKFCPHGLPGDRLWVRERMRRIGAVVGGDGRPVSIDIRYEADGAFGMCIPYPARLRGVPKHGQLLARGGFREASRIMLEIESIKVERVQDISEEDARKEGVAPCAHGGWDNYLWHGNPSAPDRAVNAWPYQFSNYPDARGSFSSLWESTHAPGAWGRNDWVWAITFRKVET